MTYIIDEDTGGEIALVTCVKYRKFAVTSRGHIYNISGGQIKILPTYKNGRGYLCAIANTLHSSYALYVHRLVAEAFLDTYSEDLQVNHKDGMKTNNSADNLEMVTAKENMQHASRIGLLDNRKKMGKGKKLLGKYLTSGV